ncbi:choline dehydrogenase-like protein [Bimuria novae-zelandiae CBS 107.79]|uniref:Choline dehydrogenase-like protein n=1 Tax=Bimuria novae-zelandiae CBS 107.79 TaxID=1447943 RepID=A0A6A5V198_9PLEO|nr:choline dehydrogenase-like protein [Bimuria novae-zelandiae CBS 107.79]
MAVFSRVAVAIPLVSALFTFVSAYSATNTTQYDYVIIGGGLTGLVVANRLSENKNKTVLVIESGENIDTVGNTIPYKANDIPAAAPLKWTGFTTQPEAELGNKTFNVNVGKVLGGGSVINGMVYDRGNAADYDAWEALGNEGWGWAGMKPYFIKGTTFQPPSPEVAEAFNITWDPDTYGNGPLSVSITDTQYADINEYWAAWKASGVNVPVDGNDGAVGPSWFGNTMDKTTGRRAHARYAYYDPIVNRTNLHVWTKTTAQKIVWDEVQQTLARGVEIQDANNKTSVVFARKEVVLAAGAVQTPKLLQISGVGPRSILEAAGVKVRYENDGIGSNFQDHSYGTIVFNTTSKAFPNVNSLTTNETFNASAWEEYVENRTGPYTYARGNALAFISLPDMTSEVHAVVNGLNNQSAALYLPKIYRNNTKLLKGFKAQRGIIADLFKRKDAAVTEFPVPPDGAYGLVGIEKPLSRGIIHLNPTNPTGPPLIQFNAFQNPVDKQILGIGTRFFRSVWNRPELSELVHGETVPGAQYTTDDEIFSALLAQSFVAPTLSHPSASCPMMAEESGGCVDSALMVYGTQHLSIVDASIIPIIPACHLQATMYGVGEKAADLIKARQ